MGCSTIHNKEQEVLTVEDGKELWNHNRQLRKEMTELKAQFDLMQTQLTKQSYEITTLKQTIEILTERSLSAKYEVKDAE